MKGLLVDYGGVLTTSVLDAFAAFARHEGLEPKTLGGVMRQMIAEDGSIFRRVEVGEIDTDEFEMEFAEAINEKLQAGIEPRGLKTRLFSAARPDDLMLAALRSARSAGIRTCLVSNSWGITDGGYPVEDFPELFDATILSGEVGLRKPDPAIYLLAAERVGLSPSECVFVDDFEINVDGAEAVGMIGIHHKETGETLELLEGLFGISFGR